MLVQKLDERPLRVSVVAACPSRSRMSVPKRKASASEPDRVCVAEPVGYTALPRRHYDGAVSERFDVAVVGGGFGGLAAAMALPRTGRRIVLLEAESNLGGLAGTFRVR